MFDLSDWIKKVRNYENYINEMLSGYDTSPARIIKLDKTIEKLESLSISQKVLFGECILCVQNPSLGLFRAAHVLAWAAMADYLEHWLAEDNFKKLSLTKGIIAAKKRKDKLRYNKKMLQAEKNKIFEEDKLEAEKKWKFQSVEELRDSITEHAIIISMRECGFFGKAEEKSLLGLLSKRNECAHPSDYEPGFNETLGFISELLNRIGKYEKKRI